MKRVALITTLVLATALALVSSALADPIVASAQSGWVGPYKIGYSSCLNSIYVGNQIAVTVPRMAAFNSTAYLDSQQVGWQALLYRWNGQSWQQVRATTPEYAWATDQAEANFGPSISRYFNSVSSGYYHVVIQVFWCRSATVAYGGTATVLPAMAYGFGSDPALCTID